MVDSIQKTIDSLAEGESLKLSPTFFDRELQGPLELKKGIRIDGMDCTIYSSSGPALSITGGDIVLENMMIAATGKQDEASKRSIIKLTGGRISRSENVEVFGEVQGIAGEEGHWEYPRQIALGIIPAGKRCIHRFSMDVPCQVQLASSSNRIAVEPSSIGPGSHEIMVTVQPGAGGDNLIEYISINTCLFKRVIHLTAFPRDEDGPSVVPAAVPDGLHCKLDISWLDAEMGAAIKFRAGRKEPCERCGATGVQSGYGSNCMACGGSGLVTVQRELTVRIKPNTKPGSMLVITESGDFVPAAGRRDDVLVELNVRPGQPVNIQRPLVKKPAPLVIYLLDTSAAMASAHGNAVQHPWSMVVADILNRHFRDRILDTIRQDIDLTGREVGVITHGGGRVDGFAGNLAGKIPVNLLELAENPARIETRKVMTVNDQGKSEQDMLFPVWVEAAASGEARMDEALQKAISLVRSSTKRGLSTVPIIINIGAVKSFVGISKKTARMLSEIGCYNGGALLFNISVSPEYLQQIVFGSSDIRPANEATAIQFNLCSGLEKANLPEKMSMALIGQGFKFNDMSRASVFAAERASLVRLLRAVSAMTY